MDLLESVQRIEETRSQRDRDFPFTMVTDGETQGHSYGTGSAVYVRTRRPVPCYLHKIPVLTPRTTPLTRQGVNNGDRQISYGKLLKCTYMFTRRHGSIYSW